MKHYETEISKALYDALVTKKDIKAISNLLLQTGYQNIHNSLIKANETYQKTWQNMLQTIQMQLINAVNTNNIPKVLRMLEIDLVTKYNLQLLSEDQIYKQNFHGIIKNGLDRVIALGQALANNDMSTFRSITRNNPEDKTIFRIACKALPDLAKKYQHLLQIDIENLVVPNTNNAKPRTESKKHKLIAQQITPKAKTQKTFADQPTKS